jgi:hypothetical protein
MPAMLWRPVQPSPDPRLRFVLAHPKRPFGGLDLVADAPTRDKRPASDASGKQIEAASLSTPRIPDGVIAQSAPQFSASQTVIRACCRPRPSGGMAMRMRTGKRRSAPVISSRGLPGIVFLVCSSYDCMAASPCPAAWPPRPGAVMLAPCVAAPVSPTGPGQAAYALYSLENMRATGAVYRVAVGPAGTLHRSPELDRSKPAWRQQVA